MAEKQAAPMLQALKAQPRNAKMLAAVGNLFYDAQQFKDAINYYERSLKAEPRNLDVRTDLGNALFYSGKPKRAIEEYDRVLKADPKHADALINRKRVESLLAQAQKPTDLQNSSAATKP